MKKKIIKKYFTDAVTIVPAVHLIVIVIPVESSTNPVGTAESWTVFTLKLLVVAVLYGLVI